MVNYTTIQFFISTRVVKELKNPFEMTVKKNNALCSKEHKHNNSHPIIILNALVVFGALKKFGRCLSLT